MTALIGHPGTPPDLDADTRLASAIAALCDPARVPVDRADALLDTAAAQLLADDRAVERELQVRHTAHLAARRYNQATRVLAQLTDHRARADRRRQRIAAVPDEAEIPPLLDQLEAETGASSGRGTGGSAGPHRSIIAIPATELLGQIRRTVGHRDRDLVDAVRLWADFPEDVAAAAAIALGWADQIRTLLDPPKRWHHPGACPDCGQRIAHVPDDTGQIVRTPAIEFDVVNSRARCLCCPARWTSEAQLRSLANVLFEQQAITLADPPTARTP